ncbi:putative conserved small protein [Frankia torreyi]|uniref:Putative conserved small protein n=1 Tax=Frankia torreyi TaxID=1856 RepID=A0A0D8BBN4_9ACTN|nr:MULTISPECIES: helix-turn-helix transcriptional regulator [Frankia]KJE21505.1 putative conserved small protein [Frankia torreyi]KQM03500.1 transcriptional regulator, XRE family [Frankia sp. CpI1-P]
MTRRRPLPTAPAGLWDRPDMAAALAERDMQAILTIYKRWTGASQPQIATMTGVPQPTISLILNGKRHVSGIDTFEKFAEGLDIPRERLGLAAPKSAEVEPANGPNRRTVLAVGAAWAIDEELEEVTRRMQAFAASNVDDTALDQLETSIEVVGRRYETSDAATVYPVALKQRRWVAELLTGHQHPSQRAHLYLIGGKLSGLLGYLAFDLGNELVARAYCNEAMSLAKAAGHGDLAAWVRGTQSFIAYYGGRYREALDLARDGQRYARGGPASIRLAISGEARTLGKLGDAAGVDEAVGRALAAHAKIEDADPVGYFLSFDPFTASRIAGNAASAYLAAGAHLRAREFTDQAIPIFAAADSTASHALTLVDASMTYLAGPSPEPDRAGVLVSEALAIGADLRSEVVARRAKDFLTTAAQWRTVPEIANVHEAVKAWRLPTA